MPSTRIALVGFGRVGRNLFRILYRSEDIEVAAISDPADPKALEYLLRYDTLHGRFPDEVSLLEGHLYTRGRQIPVMAEGADGGAPWGDLGIDTVIEAITITGGHHWWGGCMNCSAGYPTVRGCRFVGNVSTGEGGALASVRAGEAERRLTSEAG